MSEPGQPTGEQTQAWIKTVANRVGDACATSVEEMTLAGVHPHYAMTICAMACVDLASSSVLAASVMGGVEHDEVKLCMELRRAIGQAMSNIVKQSDQRQNPGKYN